MKGGVEAENTIALSRPGDGKKLSKLGLFYAFKNILNSYAFKNILRTFKNIRSVMLLRTPCSNMNFFLPNRKSNY